MGDRFVSEKELEEEKKRKQEEWERVRKPDDPKIAPDEPVDNRPLYDRLKEQRDKKQLDYEETHRFKNMVRGLDTEEAGFLDFVDNMKSAEEKKRESEEKSLLAEVQKLKEQETLALQEMATASSSSLSNNAPKKSAPKRNAQAELLSKAVKRRSSEADASPVLSKKRPRNSNEDEKEEICQTSTTDESSKSGSNDHAPKSSETSAETKGPRSGDSGLPIGSATFHVGVRPAAMRVIGILPGLGEYGTVSSDEQELSDTSDSDEGDYITTMLPVSSSIKSAAESAGNNGRQEIVPVNPVESELLKKTICAASFHDTMGVDGMIKLYLI